MKIRLYNFKCYNDRTFELGSQGLVLISGKSGSGKTSIIEGVHFALYGSGSDLIAGGKSSCFVELDFDDLSIKRTKRPNRLVVKEGDVEYEGDSAQDIISRRFGSTFETCGYIAQDAINSFITMSPIDKLAFLEKFAFKDINLTGIKSRCKNLIKETNDSLIAVTTKLEMTRSVFDEMERPEKVAFPIKSTNREKTVKNENIRYKNSLIMIGRQQKALKQVTEELNQLNVFQTFLKAKQDALDKVNEKIANLELDQEEIDFQGDEKLAEYKSQLDYLLSCRELTSLESQYSESIAQLEEMKEKEVKSNQEEIDNISKVLWSEYTREDLKDCIDDCKSCLVDMEELSKYESELKRYKIDINDIDEKQSSLDKLRDDLDIKKDLLTRIRLEQQIYTCPVCQSSLQVCDEELCVADEKTEQSSEEEVDDIEQDINDITLHISRLERLIPELRNKKERYDEISQQIQEIRERYEEVPSISSLKEDIEYLKSYESSQFDLERKKKTLEKNVKSNNFSIAINTFEKDVEKLRRRITELKQKTKYKKGKLNEEQLKDIIDTQKRYKLDLKRIKASLAELTNDKDNIEYDIDTKTTEYTSKYTEVRDLSLVQDEVDTLEQEISTLQEKRDKHANNLSKIEKYTENQKQILKYNEWKQKLKDVTEQEKKAQEKHAAAILLREKILEAESVAMLNVINSINTHAQVYLDEFFPDDPVVVRLSPFKETKKSTKPQINLEVQQDGMESGIGRLSGGEKSRVVLAFTLALADMFNIPMIMLDECTSSLDQDSNADVISSLKEHFANKLVLIIAHQVVTGVFDKIIYLEKHKVDKEKSVDVV